MKTVFIDPPFSPSGDWARFGFSDIIWGYVQHANIWNRSNTYVLSSYRTLPDFDTVQWITIPAQSMNLRNIVMQYLLYRKFAKAVMLLDPDIVLSPDYFSLAIISRFTTKPNFVLTTPGSISERVSTFNPYDRTYTFALQWAKHRLQNISRLFVLASSQYMQQWWERDEFRHVTVIPLPVTTFPFVVKEDARNKLLWPSSVYHLLFVGSLRQENNIVDALALIRRLNKLSETSKPFHLHIVGGGAGLSEVQKAYRNGVSLTIHGQVNPRNMSVFYSAADALVVPRSYNAVPRVALEALCCGTPIVANLNESIQGFDSVDCYILQQDLRQLRGPIIETFLHATERLQKHISEKARSQFDSTVVEKNIQEYFRTILY